MYGNIVVWIGHISYSDTNTYIAISVSLLEIIAICVCTGK